MTETEIKVNRILDELTSRICAGEFKDAHKQLVGIRSRQVVALITLLVEKGVL